MAKLTDKELMELGKEMNESRASRMMEIFALIKIH